MDNRLPEETNPASPLTGWKVKDAIAEMQAAVNDARWFCDTMDRSERTRLCDWDGKNGTGRKINVGKVLAQPWDGAADHEVHLVQWLIRLRTAMRLAALRRGALSVTPMEGTDARKAGAMKLVMRYFMETAMGTMPVVQGSRAGAWTDRYGHSLLYVGWKFERAVEKRTVTRQALIDMAIQSNVPMTPDGQPAPGVDVAMIAQETEVQFEMWVMEKGEEDRVGDLLLQLDPGLKARGKAGEAEAARVVRELRKGSESVEYFSSYIKSNHPCWEALVPFVDVFYPAETVMEDNLDSARWIARVKWMSPQQLREQAEIMGWDKKWVAKVLKKRGKPTMFNNEKGRGWVMGGAGVRWQTRNTADSESERNLIQIIEMWDRSTTSDGLRGVYHTVMHADIHDSVASRELLPYWCGSYPFVAITHEAEEKLLLANRGVPEPMMTAQQAIKAQWDSRTDAASLTTLPPWTGPAELKGTRIRPNAFIEQWQAGSVSAFQLPVPDGRSIEIEKTIRASVNQFYGIPSDEVPDSISMLMGQSDMDWFLMGISRAVALTAMLVQQYMPTLTGARITGTDIVFNASPEDVRGSFDFAVKFDVRALDVEWTKELLTFIKDLLVPLDRNGKIKTGPLIEFGFNVLDPALASASLLPDDVAAQAETDAGKSMMTDIFSGGQGADPSEGQDYKTRAKAMKDELLKSPLRQAMLQNNPQIHAVYVARLKQLLALDKQYGENVVTGQMQGEQPLAQPDELDSFLAELEGKPAGA